MIHIYTKTSTGVTVFEQCDVFTWSTARFTFKDDTLLIPHLHLTMAMTERTDSNEHQEWKQDVDDRTSHRVWSFPTLRSRDALARAVEKV